MTKVLVKERFRKLIQIPLDKPKKAKTKKLVATSGAIDIFETAAGPLILKGTL
jgi:hypothetical protein